MAGAVKSRPGTKEWRERYDEAMYAQPAADAPPDRVEAPHECERCGKRMKYADQSCACTARDPWMH